VSALAILGELQRRGVSVTADGDALVLKPRRAVDDAILGRIREAKPAILKALKQAWPPESEAQARRFGQSHARLFPFIRKRVWTPTGPGVLLSAYAEQCEILPDGAAKTIRVRTQDVRPIQ